MKSASNSILDNMGSVSLHEPRYRYSGKEEAEGYYQYSPYTYCANNPTNLIDPDGERILATNYFTAGIDAYMYEWIFTDGDWQFVDYFTKDRYVIGTHSYIDALTTSMKFIMSGPLGKSYIEKLVATPEVVLIGYDIRPFKINLYRPYNDVLFVRNGSIGLYGIINWYSPEKMKYNYSAQLMNRIETEYNIESSSYLLIHELAHFYDHLMGRNMEGELWDLGDASEEKLSESEKYAMHIENIIRVEHDSDIRIRYYANKGFSLGNDLVIDINTGRSLFFTTGDIFDTKILKLEKHETGYKYK